MGIYFGSEDKKTINLEAHSGKNGISAYEVAVKNGFLGTEEDWLASLKGEKGDKGDTGKATKSAVVIAHSASGANADMCDFLYNEEEDFSEVLSEASSYAQSLGIDRIEVMTGVYRIDAKLRISVKELIGVGDVTIERKPGTSGFMVLLRRDVVTIENIYIAQDEGMYSVEVSQGTRAYLRRVTVDGVATFSGIRVSIEDCVFTGNLRLVNSADSYVVNCDIGKLTVRLESQGTVISSCKINTLENEIDGLVLRDNEIGGEFQKLSAEEKFMGVRFGRVVSENATESVTLPVTAESFEIYINEKSNMTVNLYTGGTTPAKSLTSDTFIFMTGNLGDDIDDGGTYQKTLILYLKSTLGMPSLSKWIACSGSDEIENVKIEIVCPANTYRGILENKTGTIYCDV